MMDRNDASDSIFNVTLKHFNISVPPESEPKWAESVARWHQLDESTYALVEAAYRFKTTSPDVWEHVQPQSIWIAAPGGSNIADNDFVQNGSRSPSRFVGTLPSIRSSSLTLFMNWAGPVMCLQSGEQTLAQGFEEIYWHLCAKPAEPTWLVTSSRSILGKGSVHLVSFFCFSSSIPGGFVLVKKPVDGSSCALNHFDLVAKANDTLINNLDLDCGLSLMRRTTP